ncbi:hypothetical protein BDF19DRAFT_440121 [Syncephalis fuscata]|nr:hypothetical protein BDF19DRAFT_440121 [Syncephalis fuscata]
MTPLARAVSIFAAGLLASAAIILLLHDPPYPTPRHLGTTDPMTLLPTAEENYTQHHLVASPVPHSKVKVVGNLVYLAATQPQLVINDDGDYTQYGQVNILYRSLYNNGDEMYGSSNDKEQAWTMAVTEQLEGCISTLPNDTDNWIHVLYYTMKPHLQFRLRSYQIVHRHDSISLAQCAQSTVYPIDEIHQITMCDIELPGNTWIEDAIVDNGLFIYTRRPDIARFRVYQLPHINTNSNTLATSVISGPILNEKLPEKTGFRRLPTSTNVTRILLAEVRQQDLAGNFDFKVRLISNAGQSAEISRDITRRWTHTQVIDSLYHSMDVNRISTDIDGDPIDDDVDKPKFPLLSRPMPIITSGLHTTIVAFPHSQVLFSLDEIDDQKGHYKLRPLEVPYVENASNAVAGLYVNSKGSYLAIVTTDNTIMLFSRGNGDSFLELLLRDDARDIDDIRNDENTRGEAPHLNLLRNARDDLARRWRLKAIIPASDNITSVVDAVFINVSNQENATVLVLLHADNRLSQWHLTSTYSTWSWPLALYTEHWVLCLIMTAIVMMFSVHELRLR